MADLFSDIIRRCKRGDRKAQESVYNLLAGKMFGVCLRYCANYEEAKDVLHDGFVTVFTKIGQFQHTGSFEGWVRKIIVNHALERYRVNNKTPYMVSLEDEAYQLAAPEPDQDQHVDQLSEKKLMSFINSLPPQYKAVFNMYAIDGMSHKEISEVLHISESTSRTNLLRARSILQKQVNDIIDPFLSTNVSKRRTY